jgi:hypothetical protein
MYTIPSPPRPHVTARGQRTGRRRRPAGHPGRSARDGAHTAPRQRVLRHGADQARAGGRAAHPRAVARGRGSSSTMECCRRAASSASSRLRRAASSRSRAARRTTSSSGSSFRTRVKWLACSSRSTSCVACGGPPVNRRAGGAHRGVRVHVYAQAHVVRHAQQVQVGPHGAALVEQLQHGVRVPLRLNHEGAERAVDEASPVSHMNTCVAVAVAVVIGRGRWRTPRGALAPL